ncbi:hypothetical protein Tco_1288445 [Tanacetum coccineum]
MKSKVNFLRFYLREISDFATPVIQSTINESCENVVLAKSSSQPQLTYEAATSLTKDLCDALVKSYQLDKDLFDSYDKAYSLKRGHEDRDKDEDPPSKESKSSSSKGSKSQSISSGKSAQAEEPMFETADTKMPQYQGDDLGNTKDQPNAGKQIGVRPPQTWISKMAKAGKPPTTFDELMSTPIKFSAYVLHNLKIENLTQEHLVKAEWSSNII